MFDMNFRICINGQMKTIRFWLVLDVPETVLIAQGHPKKTLSTVFTATVHALFTPLRLLWDFNTDFQISADSDQQLLVIFLCVLFHQKPNRR